VKVKWNMNDPEDVQLHIPAEDTTVDVSVEALGQGRYRLTNFPIGACRLRFGDVIEARLLPDGVLEYVRRVERTPFKIYSYIVSSKAVESETLRRLLDKVLDLGGHWERVFGGVLLIALPKGVEWDPESDFPAAEDFAKNE
jgi:hypothetical protein